MNSTSFCLTLKIFFEIFVYVRACVCMHIRVCFCECMLYVFRCLWRPEVDIESLGSGFREGCELPDGVGNQTLVFWRSSEQS